MNIGVPGDLKSPNSKKKVDLSLRPVHLFSFQYNLYPFYMQLVTPSVAPMAVRSEIKILSTSFQFSFDIGFSVLWLIIT